jgi:hypothetical protein
MGGVSNVAVGDQEFNSNGRSAARKPECGKSGQDGRSSVAGVML